MDWLLFITLLVGFAIILIAIGIISEQLDDIKSELEYKIERLELVLSRVNERTIGIHSGLISMKLKNASKEEIRRFLSEKE